MRSPMYESLDQNGANRPYEVRRETIAARQAAGGGRPSPAARATGHSPDAATRQAWNELAEISDLEHRRMILRQLELQAG